MPARRTETGTCTWADALQIPNILIEIGRLREYTFRQVGEGSGKACDLDTYDNHYKHLVPVGQDPPEDCRGLPYGGDGQDHRPLRRERAV